MTLALLKTAENSQKFNGLNAVNIRLNLQKLWR